MIIAKADDITSKCKIKGLVLSLYCPWSISILPPEVVVPLWTKVQLFVGVYMIRLFASGFLWTCSLQAVNLWYIERRADVQGYSTLVASLMILVVASIAV